jgi:hypothetical protein
MRTQQQLVFVLVVTFSNFENQNCPQVPVRCKFVYRYDIENTIIKNGKKSSKIYLYRYYGTMTGNDIDNVSPVVTMKDDSTEIATAVLKEMLDMKSDIDNNKDRTNHVRLQRQQKHRAIGRWNLLRDAIVSSSSSRRQQQQDPARYYSIHNFSGYEMIPSPEPIRLDSISTATTTTSTTTAITTESASKTNAAVLQELMKRYNCCGTSSSSSYLLYKYTIPIPYTPFFASTTPNCNHKSDDNTTNDHDEQKDVIFVYTREKESSIIRNHPDQCRYTGGVKVSLQELTCHHEGDRIDNTGNICVWDCERTLTWALLLLSQPPSSSQQQKEQHQHESSSSQQQKMSSSLLSSPSTPLLNTILSNHNQLSRRHSTTTTTILELGCGMAGLASLAIAAALYQRIRCNDSNNNQQKQHETNDLQSQSNNDYHFYITDGNMDCVHNNQINVDVMRAMKVLPPLDTDGEDSSIQTNLRNVTIECCQILWSLDYPVGYSQKDHDDSRQMMTKADVTLLSDCIHFEEFHGALLWTLVTHTIRRIIACQPNRTPSLQNFLSLIHHVNENCSDSYPSDQRQSQSPLLRITEHEYSELQVKHDAFVQQGNDNRNNVGKDYSYNYFDDNHYDPDKHQPRVFTFDLLRLPTDVDRQCIIDYTSTCRQSTA